MCSKKQTKKKIVFSREQGTVKVQRSIYIEEEAETFLEPEVMDGSKEQVFHTTG